MIKHELISSHPHSETFNTPQSNKTVWSTQVCSLFSERHSIFNVAESCFFCKYADFLIQDILGKRTANCCYPKIQISCERKR